MGYLLDIADEVSQQRAKESSIGPLADFASRLPGVPVIRITAYETEDVNGDVAWLHRLRDLLKDHPGGNRVVLTIRTLDGRKVLAEWRALSSPALRRAVAMLVRERAFSLGIVFRKSSLSPVSPVTVPIRATTCTAGPPASPVVEVNSCELPLRNKRIKRRKPLSAGIGIGLQFIVSPVCNPFALPRNRIRKSPSSGYAVRWLT